MQIQKKRPNKVKSCRKHKLKKFIPPLIYVRAAFFTLLIKPLLILSAVSIFFGSVFVARCWVDLPELEKLSEDLSRPHIIVRAKSGEILSHYGDIDGDPVTYGEIPQHLIEAVIATEDRKFFEHMGVDLWGIARAAYKNRMAGKVVQGGSTITQQLAKIVFLSRSKTFKRKVQEALLSIQLERIFSKEQIITMYLNRVFLGHAIFGIAAAARSYFGKNVCDLTVYESAIIAGMLKAPTRYAPPMGIQLAMKRADQVLLNMADAGFIKKSQISSIPKPAFINRAKPRGLLKNPYFADYIVSELPKLLDEPNQDLDVHTTFSIETQNKLEIAIQKVLSKQLDLLKKTQVAAVVLDNSGAILAMVGGRSYQLSQFNRATEARRQPGSLFKIFVYLAALEKGYTKNHCLVDEPITIGKWQPKNFPRRHVGSVSLIDAFAYSINTITVKLSEAIGRLNVIAMAQRLGINDSLPDIPSIALGVAETNLLNLVLAFATVANKGILVQDTSIMSIKNANQESLYSSQTESIFDSPRVLDDVVVEQMREMLAASVEYGTSKLAAIPGYKVYGKTGTSQNHRDAWFVGTVDQITLGVWVGHDDDTSMKRVTGGGVPALIFKEFMQMVLTQPHES